jgi:PAS domain S-box-containing protein
MVRGELMEDMSKVRRMMEGIESIMEIVRDSSESISGINKAEELLIGIRNTYEDFTRNYLDFREIADNLYDGIYISNGKGDTLFINEAYVNTTGIRKEEVIGRNVGDIEKEGKLFRGSVTMQVIKSKKMVNSLGTIVRQNKDVLVTGRPIFDEHGDIKLVVINNRDISDLKELETKVARLQVEGKMSNEEIRFLRQKQLTDKKGIFEDKCMTDLIRLVDTVAPTDTTVLITGESGTGKEVIADRIYANSNRSEKPFIKVNCSAIPAELVESELFGYEAGAFTDASKQGKIGLFELAKDGTILLDEIGDMPLSIQSKLLRVLQQKEFIRVGGKKTIKIDVRVIASTNKDLKAAVKENRFREDLYYRLNVVPVLIPPLRERAEDLKALIDEFIDVNNRKYRKEVSLTPGAMKVLHGYAWPGNIRELENFIERMVVITRKERIDIRDVSRMLGIERTSDDSDSLYDGDLKEAVHNLEKEMIAAAIRKYGSTRKASEHLGIDQSTIVKKCKKIGLDLGKL